MIAFMKGLNVVSLNSLGNTGWFVTAYRQGWPAQKETVWASSVFAQGKIPAFMQLDNAIDTLELKYVGLSSDETAQALNNLTTMLDAGLAYWGSEFLRAQPQDFTLAVDDRLVWLCVQNRNESQPRFGAVVNYEFSQELNNQEGAPFLTIDGRYILEITLIVERTIFQHRRIDRTTARSVAQAVTQYSNYLQTWFTCWPIDTFTTRWWYGYPHVLLGSREKSEFSTIKVHDVSAGAGGFTTTALPVGGEGSQAVGTFVWPFPVWANGDIFYLGSEAFPKDHYMVLDNSIASGTLVAEFYNSGTGTWISIPGWTKALHNYNEAGVGSYVVIQYQLQNIATLTQRVAIDGVTLYWIRYRLTAASAHNPVLSRIVYNTFDSAIIGEFDGDYTALLKAYLNWFDGLDGVDRTSPDRILMGVWSSARSYAGEYLDDTAVTGAPHVGVGELQTDVQYFSALPTTQANYYPNDGPLVIERFTYAAIAGAKSDDYIYVNQNYIVRGKFRLLCGAKCTKLGGGAVTGKFGIQATSLAGRYTSDILYNRMTDYVEIFDFGEVTIPVSAPYGQEANPVDATVSFRIYYAGDAGTLYFDFYWAMLLPVDEFFADIYNPNNTCLYDLPNAQALIIDSAIMKDKTTIAAYINDFVTVSQQSDMAGIDPYPLIASASGEFAGSLKNLIKVIFLGIKYDSVTGAWYHTPAANAAFSYTYFNRFKGLRGNIG